MDLKRLKDLIYLVSFSFAIMVFAIFRNANAALAVLLLGSAVSAVIRHLKKKNEKT